MEKPMNRSYEDVMRSAIIDGDLMAIQQLILLGEQHQAENRFDEAAKFFKAATSAYRLRLEDSEHAAARQHNMYHKWFTAHLAQLSNWKARTFKIDDDFVHGAVLQLFKEEYYLPIFVYLEDVLSHLGMEFYSPGGSIQRRVWVMLGELLGAREPSELNRYMEKWEVRIGLEFLASEVIQRHRGAEIGQTNEPEGP